MAATIRDIAKLVGVSPSTVSRALNGSSLISQETSQKIQDAMRKLNYHPNALAKSFATGSTGTIALIIDADNEKNFANNFFNRSMYAMEKTAQNNGYNLLIINDNAEDKAISSLVYEKKADGIVIPSSCVDVGLLAMLDSEDFPYVIMGRPSISSKNLSWVDIDNEEGSYIAVRHLAGQKYKHLQLVLENLDTEFAKNREKGFQKGVLECKGCTGSIIEGYQDLEELHRMVTEAVRKKKADAFLCSNNDIAYHVLKCLKELGIQVPTEVGVVTFDNYPCAEYLDPPVTAVDVDTFQLGKTTTEQLIQLIRDRAYEAENQLIDVSLIIRASSERNT